MSSDRATTSSKNSNFPPFHNTLLTIIVIKLKIMYNKVINYTNHAQLGGLSGGHAQLGGISLDRETAAAISHHIMSKKQIHKWSMDFSDGRR